jgi:hypothetical protein
VNVANEIKEELEKGAEASKKALHWAWRLLAGLGWGVLSLILLFVALVTAINLPTVQTYLTNKLANEVNQKIGYKISLGYVNIAWFNAVYLENVVVLDKKNDTIVKADYLRMSYDLPKLLVRDIRITEITMRNGFTTYYAGDTVGNRGDLSGFIQELSALTDDGTVRPKNRRAAETIIKEVILENCNFSYNYLSSDSMPNMFDYEHFSLDKISGCASNLTFVADTIAMYMDQFSGIDRGTKLPIKTFNGNVQIDKHRIRINNLLAHIGNSKLENYLEFNFDTWTSFSSFNDSVTIKANLLGSTITAQDLAYFAPELKQFQERVKVWGKVRGTVSNLNVKNFLIQFGLGTELKGNISLKGLPNWDSTLIDLNLKEGSVIADDIAQYITKNDYATASKFGIAILKGNLKGYPMRFKVDANLDSDLGELSANLAMNLNKNPALSTYSGHLSTTSFQLGTLLDADKTLQAVTAQGEIDGRGMVLNAVSANLTAQVSEIGILGYNYQNVDITEATFEKLVFNGQASIEDKNLRADFTGLIDLNKGQEKFDLVTNVLESNPAKLGLVKGLSEFSTYATLKFTSLDFDQLEGSINLLHNTALYNGNYINSDTIDLVSSRNGSYRSINLRSDLASGEIKGNYELKTVLPDLVLMGQEYVAALLPQYAANDFLVAKAKKYADPNYDLEFNFYFKDINPILKAFETNLSIAPFTSVVGTANAQVTEKVKVNLKSGEIKFKDYGFKNVLISFDGTKPRDQNSINAKLNISSTNQQLGTLPKTNSLIGNFVWQNDVVNFNTGVKQDSSTNEINLNGNILMTATESQLHLNPSLVRLLELDWRFTDKNKIVALADGSFRFDSLLVKQGIQEIDIEGIAGFKPTDKLTASVKNVDLRLINNFITEKLEGTINVDLNAFSLLKNPSLQLVANADSFTFNNIKIGSLEANAVWDSLSNQILIDSRIYSKTGLSAFLRGYYDIKDSYPLHFKAQVESAPITVLQPILSGVLNELEGTATGDIQIGGSFSGVNLSGALQIENGRFRLPYINTRYKFNDVIKIRPNAIDFGKSSLYDDDGNKANINKGLISHENWKNWHVDIDGKLNNLAVLNTTQAQSSAFYGNVKASGSLMIFGPTELLSIKGDLRSEKGSKFAIPIVSSGGYTGNANIRFFNSKVNLDSLTKKLGPKAPDLSGITMDFNLDLTNDLDVEIIFDERAGEKIKTNGNGRLKFTYDSRGDIAIYGQYLFDRGTYNFTLSNAINKKFNIQAGSSITWNGSVYNGTADIKAEHELYASLNPLITESMLGGEDRSVVLAQPQYRRKYQTKVFLDLKGALLTPEITMRVDVVDNPQDAKLVQAVNNFRSVIASNEAILNQQVLSLFLFRAFSPIDNSSESNSTNLATGTISELLSNQFSNWLSSVNNNFEVQLDVNGLDANAITNLQLRLSYALLDGRLKVTRSGGVGNGSANNASAIAGDWYLEYRLTPDGKLWAKAFARNNQFYTSTLANTQTTTGASIFHTASFNSFSDLWGGNKRKKERQKASQTIIVESSELPVVPKTTPDTKEKPEVPEL